MTWYARKAVKRATLKTRTPTAAEQRHMDRVASLGCIACLLDGHVTPEVSLHHTDGRVKPGCHYKVLPLCAGHHQDGTGMPGLLAIHPYKARFEARYGSEEYLLGAVKELLWAKDELLRHGMVPEEFKARVAQNAVCDYPKI